MEKRGPNYVEGKKVELWKDNDWKGGNIQLGPGYYLNLKESYGFNDVVSSVKFV